MAQKTLATRARLRPMHRLRLHPQNQRSTGLGMRFLLKHKKDCRSMLHRSAKPEPHIELNITDYFRRNVTQIQNHQPEAPAVQNQICGAKGLVNVLAPHPQ